MFFFILALSAVWLKRIIASLDGHIFCGRAGHVLRHAVKTMVDTTKAKCAFHCMTDNECTSFTYQSSGQTCVLHAYDNTSVLPSIASDISSWYSPYNCIVLSKLTDFCFVSLHSSWLEVGRAKISTPLSSFQNITPKEI